MIAGVVEGNGICVRRKFCEGSKDLWGIGIPPTGLAAA